MASAARVCNDNSVLLHELKAWPALLQENPHGFFPIRDPTSKWYIPFEDMPDDVVPWKAV